MLDYQTVSGCVVPEGSANTYAVQKSVIKFLSKHKRLERKFIINSSSLYLYTIKSNLDLDMLIIVI